MQENITNQGNCWRADDGLELVFFGLLYCQDNLLQGQWTFGMVDERAVNLVFVEQCSGNVTGKSPLVTCINMLAKHRNLDMRTNRLKVEQRRHNNDGCFCFMDNFFTDFCKRNCV